MQDIVSHLSMPKRGPQDTLGYHRVFNLIVWVLYTGMQWKCFPVRQDRDGTATIHELAASFQESRRGIPWLWWRPRVADEGAVRIRIARVPPSLAPAATWSSAEQAGVLATNGLLTAAA